MLKHNYTFSLWPEAPWKGVTMKQSRIYLVSFVVVLAAGLIGQFLGPSIDAWIKERVRERVDAYWLPRIADCIDAGGETTVLSISRHSTLPRRIIIVWAESWPERLGKETAYIKAAEHYNRLFGCALAYDRWDTVSLVRVTLSVTSILSSDKPQPKAVISFIMVATREIAMEALTYKGLALLEWFMEMASSREAHLQIQTSMEMYDFQLNANNVNRDWRLAFERARQ